MIDALAKRAEAKVAVEARRTEIAIYSGALSDKFSELSYCVARLRQVEQGLLGKREFQFYTDAFWSVAWTCLDMLGQVVNQTETLGFDEKDASFYEVAKHVHNHHSGTDLDSAMLKLRDAVLLKRIKGYRHCAIHRRSLFIALGSKHWQFPTGYAQHSTSEIPNEPKELRICKLSRRHELPKKFAPQNMVELIPVCEKTVEDLDRALTRVLKLLVK